MRVPLVLVLAAAAVAAAPKNLRAKELGVFPIDPLRLSRVDIAQGTGPVSIDLHFTDLDIYGLKNTLVDTLKSDVDNVHYHADVHIPQGINLKGQYKIDGKVLVLPIKGEGPCELQLDNVTALVDLHGAKYTKDSGVYGNITDFKFTLNTSRLKIGLENLFNGNKELSDNMNVFLNENWNEILNELKPAIQDAFGAAFREITNRIFSRIPYDKLFT